MSTLDTAPVAALPLDDEPQALDYSRGDSASLEPARPALIAMTWLSVLSGLCVASCFVVLLSRVNPAAIALHMAIYAVTLWLAVRSGRLLARYDAPSLRSTLLPMLDLIAGIGLLVIAVSPLLLLATQLGFEEFAAGLIGGAFLLLCVSTPRHLILYRGLSGLFVGVGRVGLARWLTVLGWIKFVYEGLWLLCCCTPLLLFAGQGKNGLGNSEGLAVFMGFGALFGAAGFTVVWIMMMITHGRLAAVTRRRWVGDDRGNDAEVPPEDFVVQPPVGGPLRL